DWSDMLGIDVQGIEWWTVSMMQSLVAAENSGLQVSNPLASAEVSGSWKSREFNSFYDKDKPVRVWKGKKPGSTWLSIKSSSLSPLPIDREVCIKEIHEKEYRDEWAVASASTIGLLGSPLEGGPFLATF